MHCTSKEKKELGGRLRSQGRIHSLRFSSVRNYFPVSIICDARVGVVDAEYLVHLRSGRRDGSYYVVRSFRYGD